MVGSLDDHVNRPEFAEVVSAEPEARVEVVLMVKIECLLPCKIG